MKNMTLHIINIAGAADLLFAQLQSGFFVEGVSGMTLREFMVKCCNIPESYIREKIKTIFHNSSPVDNPDAIRIDENSVCAFSGAMPGVAGAMFRMDSPYSAMRKSITAKEMNVITPGEPVLVTVKLFNVVLGDLGNNFISSGIILESNAVALLIKKAEAAHGNGFFFDMDGRATASSDAESLPCDCFVRISAC